MREASAPKPTNRENRRDYRPSAERRVEILAAAQAEFIRANFSGARTREIAAAAGVNEATLFKLFASKEALFEEAVMRPLTEAMQGMHGRVEEYKAASNPAEMAKLAEASTVMHLEDMRRILPLLTTALFSDLESGQKLFKERLEPLIRERGKVLLPIAKQGFDAEFLGLASFGMMFAVALQRWFSASDEDFSGISKQFNQLYSSGFARE